MFSNPSFGSPYVLSQQTQLQLDRSTLPSVGLYVDVRSAYRLAYSRLFQRAIRLLTVVGLLLASIFGTWEALTATMVVPYSCCKCSQLNNLRLNCCRCVGGSLIYYQGYYHSKTGSAFTQWCQIIDHAVFVWGRGLCFPSVCPQKALLSGLMIRSETLEDQDQAQSRLESRNYGLLTSDSV